MRGAQRDRKVSFHFPRATLRPRVHFAAFSGRAFDAAGNTSLRKHGAGQQAASRSESSTAVFSCFNANLNGYLATAVWVVKGRRLQLALYTRECLRKKKPFSQLESGGAAELADKTRNV